MHITDARPRTQALVGGQGVGDTELKQARYLSRGWTRLLMYGPKKLYKCLQFELKQAGASPGAGRDC